METVIGAGKGSGALQDTDFERHQGETLLIIRNRLNQRIVLSELTGTTDNICILGDVCADRPRDRSHSEAFPR